MTTVVFFGLLSTGMIFISRIYYLKSIFAGITRPHAFSWLIWGSISSIGFAAQVVEGAGAGSWARGFAAATCFLLAVLGYYKGDRAYTRADWITLAVAFTAIPLWMITKTPVWSVILVCFIDTLGYLPTVRKSWHKPTEESAAGYGLFTLGAMFSLLALENYTISTWLYPVVLVISNASMAVYLLVRRQRKTAIA